MVVAARGGGSVLPARSTKLTLRALFETAMPGVAEGAASSMMVFHSPQVSQRPAHFGVTAPQDWQTKRATDLAMVRLQTMCVDQLGRVDQLGTFARPYTCGVQGRPPAYLAQNPQRWNTGAECDEAAVVAAGHSYRVPIRYIIRLLYLPVQVRSVANCEINT